MASFGEIPDYSGNIMPTRQMLANRTTPADRRGLPPGCGVKGEPRPRAAKRNLPPRPKGSVPEGF